MMERADFLVPYQNGVPFPEKPILTYWAVAATTPFTGGEVTPFGSRVPSLLGGLLLVLVAVGAAAWLGASRLAARSFRPVRVLYPVRAAIVVALVAAPWYVLSIHRFGWDYAYELIVRHNLVRFAAAWDHIHPFWYYAVEKIWSDFFPWTLPALAAVFFLWRRGEIAGNPRLASVLRAVGLVFLLLSISRSKQGKYLLFLYPFLAAVLSLLVTRLREADDAVAARARLTVRAVLGVSAAVLVVAALALHPALARKSPADAGLAPWIAIPMGLGGTAALFVLVWRRREIAPAAFALAGGLWLTEAALGARGFPALNDDKTARQLYERLRPNVDEGEPLAYASRRFRSYPLIVLDRRLDWVRTPGELLAWLAKHPDGWVITEKSEFDRWVVEKPGLKSLSLRDSQREGSDTGLVYRLALPGG